MKLLFVLPEYYPHSGGGISTYYQELIPALKPYCSNIKIIVGSGFSQGGKDVCLDGIEVSYLQPELFKKYVTKFSKYKIFPEFLNNLAAAWAMWEQMQNEEFDAIECVDFGLGFIPWLIDHSRPVKIQLHGSTGQIGFFDPKPDEALQLELTKHTEMLFFQMADSLQTHSKSNKSFWEQQLPNTIVNHVLPIYQNITPHKSFKQRSKFGLVTGRVQYWKGPTVVCEAERITKSPIQWIGRYMPFKQDNKSMKEYLIQKYPDIWNKYINVLDPIPNIDIRNKQSSARFGLISSIWDMFNFSCLEFMSAGTLTICADGAGVSEIISNGENGFKYSSNQPKELADILYALNNLSEKDYNKIAISGQQTIQDKLSAATLAPLYIRIFSDIISSFSYTKRNDYRANGYLPEEENYTLDYLLDKQPLKEVASYSLKRIRKKIIN